MSYGAALTVRWWAADEPLPAWCAASGGPLGPGLAELLDWPRLEGGAGGVLAVSDAEGVAALLPLSIERRRLRGVALTVAALPGENFFDYLPGVCRPGVDWAAVWPALVPWGRRLGWDALELRHQLLDPMGSGGEWQMFANRVFAADREDKGWAFLTRKESLKRHRNRAKRNLDYRVEQYRHEIPAGLLAEVARLHQERWRFDGIDSLFAEPGRSALYQRQAGRAWVTVVRDGEAVLAAHVGFRQGDVVLWHTPVVNIRYLDYSPLEILLLETAEACSSEGVQALDFGLGDEAYKTRFSNDERPVGNGLWPITLRGHLVAQLRRQSWLDGGSARLRAALARLRPSPRPVQGGLYAKSLVVAPVGESRWRTWADFSAFVDQARIQAWPLARSAYEHYRQGRQALARATGPVCAWVQFSADRMCAHIVWQPEAGSALEASDDLAALEAWAQAQGVADLRLEFPAGPAASALLRAGWRSVQSS